MAWTGDKPVLVALSGGGDSVALLHLLAAELGASRLRAVIVDHALRAGSADDARNAESIAQSLGVAADILTLSWEEGVNRSQQSAREARYRAICNHARALGLTTITTAHTGDDQAETVLMRAANGSTWRGLAGIAPFSFAPLWPEGRGIALARPLLGARRETLRAYLRDTSASWLEDPANDNPKFERVRIRRRLHELEAGGLDITRVTAIAARLRARADALDIAALELITNAVRVAFAIFIRHDEWRGPGDVRRRALSALMAAAAGASREPPWPELAALEARVMHPDHRGSTHSGVQFSPARDGVILFRDPGALFGRSGGAQAVAPQPLPVGVETVWDGRIAATATEPGWRIVPALNGLQHRFENGLVRKYYDDVRDLLGLRVLAQDRIAHAFAPDINRAKP